MVRFVIMWVACGGVARRFHGATFYASTDVDWLPYVGPTAVTFRSDREAWEFIRSYIGERGARPVLAFVPGQ